MIETMKFAPLKWDNEYYLQFPQRKDKDHVVAARCTAQWLEGFVCHYAIETPEGPYTLRYDMESNSSKLYNPRTSELMNIFRVYEKIEDVFEQKRVVYDLVDIPLHIGTFKECVMRVYGNHLLIKMYNSLADICDKTIYRLELSRTDNCLRPKVNGVYYLAPPEGHFATKAEAVAHMRSSLKIVGFEGERAAASPLPEDSAAVLLRKMQSDADFLSACLQLAKQG